MTDSSYSITIETEGKQYYAYSDDSPGVYGPSTEHARTSVLEAIRLYILACKETGCPIPARPVT